MQFLQDSMQLTNIGIALLCYAEIKLSDWLEIVTVLGIANQSAIKA